MPIVTFYNCDPKDAPNTTQPAHLGANAVITYHGKLLLERRRDNNTWALPGGGCKKKETGLDGVFSHSLFRQAICIADGLPKQAETSFFTIPRITFEVKLWRLRR